VFMSVWLWSRVVCWLNVGRAYVCVMIGLYLACEHSMVVVWTCVCVCVRARVYVCADVRAFANVCVCVCLCVVQ
jgi:hypothetical protein